MINSAKTNNKLVPTQDDLEKMFNEKMVCKDCNIDMVWTRKESQSRVITLQHYRNGSLGLVCMSCNSRHGAMKDDSFLLMPKDFKYCPCCKIEKHSNYFEYYNLPNGKQKRRSFCIECARENYKIWARENKEKHAKRIREYRLKRKIDGNPLNRKKP